MEFKRDSSFSIKPFVDQNGNRYCEAADGYVNFGDVSRNLLGMQCQYGSRYIHGEQEGFPALGKDLRFNGSDEPGDYHSIGIHPEDIEEFVHRYSAYKAYRNRHVIDPEGQIVELNEVALASLSAYLDGVGAFEKSQK